MVTGLGLRGADATAVLIQRTHDGYRPISLGIVGRYDRAGSVDGTEQWLGNDVLLRYFRDRLADRRFVTDVAGTGIDVDSPPDDLEELLYCFERNAGVFGGSDVSAALDGAPVFLALIARSVWVAIAAQRPVGPLPDLAPAAVEIYREHLVELAEHLEELRVLDAFVSTRGLRWASPADPGQRYPTDYGGQHHRADLREFVGQALQHHRDLPPLLAVIGEYAVLP
jgi:hypothetical protein